MIITSTSNERVKRLTALGSKAKLRREEDVFLAEGEKMFLEAPPEWVREVYVSESFLKRCEDSGDASLKEALRSGPCPEILADSVFGKVSDTKTPQGILCVLSMPHYSFESCLKGWRDPLLLLLEDLQDPGNLGTIFRAGEGAGADGIVMTDRCVDLFNPKTIRSTMGSVYRMPYFVTSDLGGTIGLLTRSAVTVYAACLEDSADHDTMDLTAPCAFLIGNESAGLKRETIQRASHRIKIPMAGKVESLNAAVAASVILYEAARQRRRCAEESPVRGAARAERRSS